MSTNRKGQILSTDFLIASTMFVIAIIAVYIYWSYLSNQLEETRQLNDIVDTAYLVSNVWMREGTPQFWNSSNVVDLGLQNNHRFNQSKLNELNNIGYDSVKRLAGASPYDFYMRIYDLGNNTMFSFGNLAVDPASESIVKMKRVGIMNSSIVYVDTVVWS